VGVRGVWYGFAYGRMLTVAHGMMGGRDTGRGNSNRVGVCWLGCGHLSDSACEVQSVRVKRVFLGSGASGLGVFEQCLS
jgi:hypothetical protein